jgi:hypothetical protein
MSVPPVRPGSPSGGSGSWIVILIVAIVGVVLLGGLLVCGCAGALFWMQRAEPPRPFQPHFDGTEKKDAFRPPDIQFDGAFDGGFEKMEDRPANGGFPETRPFDIPAPSELPFDGFEKK